MLANLVFAGLRLARFTVGRLKRRWPLRACAAKLRLSWFPLLLALPCIVATPALAQPADWSGEWDTYWRGSSAVLTLEQEGGSVRGTYEPGGGRIEGRLDGRRLMGRWHQRGNSGAFVFALSKDGQSFTGRYESGEYWNGSRAVPGEPASTQFTSLATPRETLRSLVTAQNEAVYTGNLRALRGAAAVLRYEGGAVDAREETLRRELLWEYVDLSTFKLRDAPGAVDGSSAVFRIGPAGASAHMDLKFQREPDGWRLVVPSQDALRGDIELALSELGYKSTDDLTAARSDSPRGVLRRFILGANAWREGGRAEALASLDLSFLPDQLQEMQAPVLADYLKQVLDRTGFVTWQEIPNDPDRATPYEHYRHPDGSLVIGRGGDTEGEDNPWRFTAETMRSVPALFTAMQELSVAPGITDREPFTDLFRLREWIRGQAPSLLDRYWLLEAWQWAALAAAALSAVLLGWVTGRMAVAMAAWIVAWRHLRIERETLRGFDWPLRTAVAGTIVVFALGWLGLAQTALDHVTLAVAVAATVATGLLLFRLVGAFGGHLRERAQETPGFVDQIFVSLFGGLLQLCIIVGTVFALADMIGLPYEGVVTGLGVGGIALAFAARDTVSNLLGGAILMADRPFKQGDLLETDQGFSSVETVGLRSTRLRTLDDSLLIVPNSQLSDRAILNWGRRRKRKIALQIGLTYDTPRSKLDEFVARLTDLYRAHPNADVNSCWIGLSGFGAYSIDIEFWGYFHVHTFDQFIADRTQLIGDIVDLAGVVGVDFALPTRMVHVAPGASSADAAALPGLSGSMPPAANTQKD